MKSLQGEKVLITGAARRIGRVLAQTLAEAGASVAITYRRSAADARALVEQMRSHGEQAYAIPCELADPESIQQAAAAAAESLQGLTLLINNAGAFETHPMESLTAAQWDAMFATNTRAPFLMTQAALPHLRAAAESRGQASRVIHIGSLGGQLPWATHAHYCASKAALHMLTQTMAKAFAPAIAVNCVAPGMIVTGEGAEDAGDYAHFVAKTPMARNGTPADVADAVLFLAQATPFITGQILTVDGGLGL